MTHAADLIDELDVLSRFNLSNADEGIKIHHTADSAIIAAVRRLHDKALVTQVDGGYLTDLGREAAEHIQNAITILTTQKRIGLV